MKSKRILGGSIGVLMALLVLGGYWISQEPELPKEPRSLMLETGYAPPQATGLAVPAVYPYSIAPGGVWTPEQAGLPHGHIEVLAHDVLGYVNYRRNGKIFWTRRQITIHAGELVIVDGGKMIRARCGNRIAKDPQTPREKIDIASKLDVPETAAVPEIPALPLSASISAPTAATLSSAISASPRQTAVAPSTGDLSCVPAYMPGYPIIIVGSSPSMPTYGGAPGHPVPLPEPRGQVYLALAFLMIAVYLKLGRRTQFR